MARTKEEKLYEELLHLVQEQGARTTKREVLTETERKRYRHRSQRFKTLLRHLLSGKGQKG